MSVMFTAVVFVLASSCVWWHLPPSFGVSVPTVHRRFTVWADAAAFDALHREILDRLGAVGELDRSTAILDAASIRKRLLRPDPL